MNKQTGFTLIEISIVLAIVGVIIAAGVSGLGEYQKNKFAAETQQKLSNSKLQIKKFALINKYLPCPDSDSDGVFDGREDRAGDACSSEYGNLPYLDLGLKEEDSLDAWNNPIRYAINREADNAAIICDGTHSASYFCNNLNDGQAVFTLDTAPTSSAIDGTGANFGNYYICNQTTNSVNCTGTPPSDDRLLTADASIVLVSYGEDGNTTLTGSTPNCSSYTGASAENCDTDQTYHQLTITNEDGNEFDDYIEYITGYEIKSEVLSPILVWKDLNTSSLPNATYNSYSLDDGSYTPLTGGTNDSDSDPTLRDVIQVDENITTALDLGKGNDYVLVGNEVSSGIEYDNYNGDITDFGSNALLNTGPGDDTVYIKNNSRSKINLGSGDDTLVMGNNLISRLNGQDGEDKVWIQSNVFPDTLDTFGTDDGNPVVIALGNNDDTLWVGRTIEDNVLQDIKDSNSEEHIVSGFSVSGTDYNPGDLATLSGGEISIQANGNYQFIPNYDFHGDFPTVTYTVEDATDSSDTDTSTINITVNEAQAVPTNIQLYQAYLDNNVAPPAITLEQVSDSGNDANDPSETIVMQQSGNILAPVNGNADRDTLVLENVDKTEWDEINVDNRIRNFELIIFKANPSTGTREYIVQ